MRSLLDWLFARCACLLCCTGHLAQFKEYLDRAEYLKSISGTEPGGNQDNGAAAAQKVRKPGAGTGKDEVRCSWIFGSKAVPAALGFPYHGQACGFIGR